MNKPATVPAYVAGLTEAEVRALTVHVAEYEQMPKQFIKQQGETDCGTACISTLTGIPLDSIPVPERNWVKAGVPQPEADRLDKIPAISREEMDG